MSVLLLLFPLIAVPVIYLGLKSHYLEKREQALGAGERRYILFSPLPLTLAFGISVLSMIAAMLPTASGGAGGATAAWASGIVSGGIFAPGVLLVVRALGRGHRHKAMLLGLAALVAGFPLLLVAGYALFS